MRVTLLLGLVGACQFPNYVVDTQAGSGQAGTAGQANQLDVCELQPCLNAGRCIPFEGSFVCLCADGFRGDTCAVDFNDCDPDPCQNGGTCVDGTDSSFCTCASGWDGATCKHNIDDCAPNPCQGGGTCVDGVSSFTCNCPSGLRGDTCEVSFGGCEPDPCQNGGTCFSNVDSSFCQCAAGWDGATCQHNVDDCLANPCKNGGTCSDGLNGRTCACPTGFAGDDCTETTFKTCATIKASAPKSPDGVYTVDPDGPASGNPPFEVLCDMSLSDGGWTLVGQEREGVSGTFKYLGLSTGDPAGAAKRGESALFGVQFAGLYSDVRIDWTSRNGGGGGIYFGITEEMFANSIKTTMPVTDFWTNDGTLGGWVNAAGGAVLCRASRSPNVRPGDTSWAVKPLDVPVGDCGCNAAGWGGHGAFYGGHSDANFCTPSGGGWAGVVGDGQTKGNIVKWATKLWIR